MLRENIVKMAEKIAIDYLFPLKFLILRRNKKKKRPIMFNYQFPTWVAIVFFIVLLTGAFVAGKWLVKKDRNYNGF